MALETLKKISQINGNKIIRETDRPIGDDGKVDWAKYDEMRKTMPIAIDDTTNMISFRIQDGPIKEKGKNGCQVDELVAAALLIVQGLNKKYPCNQNVKAMSSLYEAQAWLRQRTLDRKHRLVEGTSKA